MTKTIVEKHFDKIAEKYDSYKENSAFYYDNLKKLLSDVIPKHKRVFEVGCGTGDLLDYLQPSVGYGFDISQEMIKRAKFKYKLKTNLNFSTVWPSSKFDFIFMSDVIEHLENPEETFLNVSKLMTSKTKFINTMANPVWEPILMLWEKLGWKMPEGKHTRLTFREINDILRRIDLKVIKHDYKLLIPIKIPFLTDFINKYLEKYFKKLAFIEYFVAVKS